MKKPCFLSVGIILAMMTGACTPQTPTTPTPPNRDITEPAKVQSLAQPLAKRKIIMASGDFEKLDTVMEKLIGEWHSMPENYSEEAKAWMLKNKVSGYYNTFSWGTNKA